MPNRPGLDDDEQTKALIELWRSSSDELDRQIREVYSGILGASSRGDAHLERRLRLQGQRLSNLHDVSQAMITDLIDGTSTWIDAGGMSRVYAAGGQHGHSLPFSFTAPHRAAVAVLGADMFEDVLVATRFIDADSKAFVRDVGRKLTGFKLTQGIPPKVQGRALARELRSEFESRGMGKIVYANGSRHSFGEYGEMLIRTKTGTAFNTGTLNRSKELGIKFVELLDGADCGLESHGGTPGANGLVVPLAVAEAFPLSHPSCRRTIAPRPDLTSASPGFESVQSPGRRADQTAFEKALEAQRARKGSGRRQRRPRRARGAPGAAPAAQAAAPRVVQRASHLDLVEKWVEPRAEKALREAVEAVSTLHGPRLNARPVRYTYSTGGKNKGGHFSPNMRPPKPRQPGRKTLAKLDDEARRARIEKFYADREAWFDNQEVYQEIKIIKRKGASEGDHLVSLWHEMGHWHDWDPDAKTFDTMLVDVAGQSAMSRFMDAVLKTRAISEEIPALRTQLSYKRYLLDPREVWARAYSQWVVEELDSKLGREAIQGMRERLPGFQWADDDFEVLKPLIEQVLRDQGVME